VAVNSQSERFKRELLRGAVEENVDTLAGVPLGTTRREREARRRRWRRLAVVSGGTVAAILVTVGIWSTVASAARDTQTNGRGDVVVAAPLPFIDPVADASAEPARLAETLAAGEHQEVLAESLPLAVRTVVVDAGHGGRDGGTSVAFGLLEKDITRDIAHRLTDRLRGRGLEVMMTRESDTWVSLKDRAEMANEVRADLFVSIHVNWLPDAEARGVETYYLGPTNDPLLKEIAARENADSGFAMADARQLLEGIYADVRQTESRRLAERIQSSLFRALQADNPDIVSRGVMTAPFVVLVATDMPAVLVEVACLSNEREARLLATPRYRQSIAEALESGIAAFATDVAGPRRVARSTR
jgi:N-acetylmuramoyl-L-alanine amidase